MFRFIREFFKPGLKCNRMDCSYDNRDAIIRRKGGRFSTTVCTDYRCEIPTCKRCHNTLEPINEEEVSIYHGVSMPSHYWDEMRDKGYLRMEL